MSKQKFFMPLVLSALLLGGCGETTFSSTTTGTSSSSSSANTTSSNSEGTSSAPSSTSSSSSIAKVHCAFYNWDEETLLWSTDIKKGREVVYDGPVPTRDSSAQYSYAFKGWDKDLAGIEADTDFIAQYDRSLNQYNVSFVSDGAVLESQKVAYGAKAVYHAFDGVSSLKTIHFANNATSHLAWIDEYAFACSEGHLANVILPYGNRSDGTANAITIGYHAFANGSGAGTGASKNYIVYESGHIVAGAFSGFDYYSILLFHGTKSDWQKFENYQNAGIDVAYYLEVQPTDKANTYWHFDGSNPTIWVVK